MKNIETEQALFSDPERTFELSHGTLVNHLQLPQGTDTEKIQFSIDRLTRLTRLAGAKQLILAGADLGYERPDMFDVEMNGGGTLLAKGVQKSPKQQTNQHRYVDDDNPMRTDPLGLGIVMPTDKISPRRLAAYKADSLTLFFDKRALTDKVAEHKQNIKGAIDEKSWSTVLDQEIRIAATQAALQRYAPNRIIGVISPAMSTWFYYDVISHLSDGSNLAGAALVTSLKSLQMVVGANRIMRGEAEWGDHNWTTQIFTGARTDRLIATALYAKLGGKVVKHVR